MQQQLEGSAGTWSMRHASARAWAIASVVLAGVLALPGNFGDTDGFNAQSVREYLIVLAIAAVAAVVVFGVVVRRGLAREEAGVSALVLSVLGLVTVAAFWSGLPPVLAAGGILLGLAGWEAGRRRVMCRIAVAVGVLALVAELVAVLGDWRAIS